MHDPLFDRVARAIAGRYVLERELGHGGMGAVYLATDRKLHRQVAIKVLPPATRGYLGPERFQREVELVARLSHPHIVPLFEADEAEGCLYYVMEYVDGETLADRLRREGPLPLDDALRITAEVADALQYAHDRGIVHRDVKPANILLSRGHARVSDFGIAKPTADADTLTATGVAVGTAGYMSPEQASGERRVDARSDVYGLAAVLYEMLVGEPPFTGPSVQAIMARIIAGTPETIRTFRPTVPVHVNAAVLAALAKTPADRPPSARAFADLLARPVTGRPTRSPGRRIAVGVGAVLLAVLVVWVVRAGARRAPPAPPPNSVAVFYFENLSRDTVDAYLADGLTEGVIARLGRLERLVVLSQSAVRRYRDSSLNVTTAARTLGAANVVTGQVRRVGGGIRVTVELVRASDSRHLWGEPFVRADADLVLLENEIATGVATAIGGRLLPGDRAALAAPMTRNQEAYDLFLRGNYYFAQRTAQSVARAIEYYERAARLDPRFTEPLAQAALAHGVSLSWGWPHPGPSTDSVLARGVALAERALQQDSASADAWLAVGYLLMFRYPRTFDGVRQALQRALALNPQSAEAYHQYGYVLALLGDDSGAISADHRALRIEPDRYHTLYELGFIHETGRRFREARAWYDSALVVNPGHLVAFHKRARIRLKLGDTAGARRDAEASLRVGAENMRLWGQITLALIEAASGDTAAARTRVPDALRLLTDSTRPSPSEATIVAPVFIAAGEPERALRLLEHVSPKGPLLWWLLQSWEFDPLRGNPRFQHLVEESRPR